MDAVEEEQEVRLQRASADLLADLERSLKPFLWRTLPNGELRVRWRVQSRELGRLLTLLEPFQELPQLLDPYLERFMSVLADAFVESLRSTPTSSRPTIKSTFHTPLPEAVCKLLYTFCKIRGDKVIVRFFNAEVRILELLLSALEKAIAAPCPSTSALTWEERYITLLWLSHLLLAPFDLETLSSASATGSGTDIGKEDIEDLTFPARLPSIALRIVPIAAKSLQCTCKERDSATTLLVRISLRKDMQELGLLYALVQWALARLRSPVLTSKSPYYYIGVLSFLGGILVSSVGTDNMNPYLLEIFHAVQSISDRENGTFQSIYSSALARKAMIKILRTICVLILLGQNLQHIEVNEILETTISYLLELLADNDTTVRLSASKALSIVTLKLSSDMAAQVVDAILESLNNNVLWVNKISGQHIKKVRDLSAVRPLEWHGLILTLSHLLYRRSPPPESLSDILYALLLGLSFEQRSMSGSSIGTNVRDAACFGIWALARRYTTLELEKVKTSSVFASERFESSSSILQVLATELLVAASVDPAGNIRRGTSAALQELIGRHPDVIAEGIAVVQTVDYYAVALRSRAMLDMAPKAALLSKCYENALIDALLGWRGIGDRDTASRRLAATSIGLLARGFKFHSGETPWGMAMNLVERISQQLRSLEVREIDQRHGLLLSMAAVMNSMSDYLNGDSVLIQGEFHEIQTNIKRLLQIVLEILRDAKEITYRRPELVAEGVCRTLLAIYPLLRADLILRRHNSLGSRDNLTNISAPLNDLQPPNPELTKSAEVLLNIWLCRCEKEVVTASTEAAVNLLLIVDSSSRSRLLTGWTSRISDNAKDHLDEVTGFLFALTAAFPFVGDEQQQRIRSLIIDQWRKLSRIGDKVSILQCLTQSSLLESHPSDFIQLIAEGLDDYTTNSRGDIGSLVRIEALKASKKVFNLITRYKLEKINESLRLWFTERDFFSLIYGKVLRLSAEKLDKVRLEAQRAVAEMCGNEGQLFARLPISSYDYFSWLLNLQVHDWLALPLLQYHPSQWCPELFEGLVSSADTGSGDLIRVSRSALADFCDGGVSRNGESLPRENTRDLVCKSLFDIAKKNVSNDRILVPALEVIGFLFDVGIMQHSNIKFRTLYRLVQEAHFRTQNVRKLEASIKVYGGLLGVYPEAIRKLTSMLLHPFPKVRDHAADVLFVKKGIGKGVEWGRAGKKDLNRLLEELKEDRELEL